jgi:hypothetical protein
LVDALFDIQGIVIVQLSPYRVFIQWSAVFSSDEMVPQIERVLRQHLAL